MNIKIKFIYFFLVLFCSCSKELKIKNIYIEKNHLEFKTNGNMAKGHFVLGIFKEGLSEKQENSILLSLSSEGDLEFMKVFPVHPGEISFLLGINKIPNTESFLFFKTTSSFLNTPKAKVEKKLYKFDKESLKLTELPHSLEKNLDGHEIFFNKDGNLMLLYYTLDKETDLIHAEVKGFNKNNQIVFHWNSKNYPELIKTRGQRDYLHANTINEDLDGNYLLSFKHTSEIIKISKVSGKIIWKISNRNWKFINDPLGGFHNQHTPIMLSNGNLLMFDNGMNPKTDYSRAVEYKLNFKAKEALMVWEYRLNSTNSFRPSMGSVQRMKNGDTLISWGTSCLECEENPTFINKNLNPLEVFTVVTRKKEIVAELKSLNHLVTYRTLYVED